MVEKKDNWKLRILIIFLLILLLIFGVFFYGLYQNLKSNIDESPNTVPAVASRVVKQGEVDCDITMIAEYENGTLAWRDMIQKSFTNWEDVLAFEKYIKEQCLEVSKENPILNFYAKLGCLPQWF